MMTGGKEILVETGKLAKQADGSVVVRMGDTMLLATVVAAQDAKEGVDFLPLTVDYREKYAAAGRFPGGFFRREARPSETEILVMRLVDRALRPLFPDDYHAEVQLMIQLLSYDGVNNPDALCGFAASAAISLRISSISRAETCEIKSSSADPGRAPGWLNNKMPSRKIMMVGID
mgnify:CR=1 FL=1